MESAYISQEMKCEPANWPRKARLPLGELARRQAALLPWYYAGLLATAEVLVAMMFIGAGIALHIFMLCLLIVHAAFVHDTEKYPLYEMMGLAPLIRVLSLALPLKAFPLVYWYAVTSMPLVTAGFVAAHLAGFRLRDAGFRLGRLPVQSLVALTGVPLGAVEHFILRPAPLVSALSVEMLWFPALILMFCTGFVEEFIFRGLLQRAAVTAGGERFGLYFVAVVFTILHITHRSVLDVIFVFVVAVYFGWIVKRSGSILGVTVAHGLTNIGLYLIWPLLLPW